MDILDGIFRVRQAVLNFEDKRMFVDEARIPPFGFFVIQAVIVQTEDEAIRHPSDMVSQKGEQSTAWRDYFGFFSLIFAIPRCGNGVYSIGIGRIRTGIQSPMI